VSTNTQKKAEMYTESTNVGSSLAGNPENTKVALVVELDELGLVDGTDTELTLDGGDKRWTLEKSTCKCLQGTGELSLTTWELVVKADNADVLLSGSLLGFDKASGAVDTDDQASGNLWIESSGVTSLLNSIT